MASNIYLQSLFVNSVRRDRVLKCKANSKQCGDACVPKSKKCKGEDGDSVDAKVQAKVEYLEDKIKDLDYERALFIDPKSGKVLLNKAGEQTSVSFTPEETGLMKGAIVTHNHPNAFGYPPNHPASKGLSFSEADVKAACIAEAGEMRAVSSGYRHVLRPPQEGWNGANWAFKVEPSYKRNENQVMNEFINEISSGRRTIASAEADFHHEVISRTAKETRMYYKRTPIGK
jgi:hypothetical protein